MNDIQIIRNSAEYKRAIRTAKYNSKYHGKRVCYYCGKRLRFDEVTIDHKIPLCRGGTTEAENLVASCYRCNQSKGSLTDEEFKRSKQDECCEFVNRKGKKKHYCEE